jgi:polyisoprenyl-phosphate glycosyltransferase
MNLGCTGDSSQLLSIVLPAHNEVAGLPFIVRDILTVVESVDLRAQIIIVDDGSDDGTADVVRELMTVQPGVELIRFSRNFGHQSALLAGLRAAAGDAIILMDADGQHPPALIRDMVAHWRSGFDVVNAIRTADAESSRFRKFLSTSFYRIFSILSGIRISPGAADFRLLSAGAANAVSQTCGSPPFIRGAVPWIGFRQTEIQFAARPREHGVRSFTIGRSQRMARDAFKAHMARPLRLVALVGMFGSTTAVAVSIYAVVIRVFSDEAIPGWASILAVTSLQFLLVFVILSLIATAMGDGSRGHSGRPPYIIASHDR